MNVAARAHRILSVMSNFQEARFTDDWPSKLADGCLGEAIGCYRNSGSADEVIGIFTDGLAWRDSGRAIRLHFSDLVEVKLPSGKESEGLMLLMRDGRQEQMPVKGRRGRFFDSMEMLRFVDRVMQDLQKSK